MQDVGYAAAERFWAKVERGAESECWPWKVGARNYGHFQTGGRVYLAHRFAYLLANGDIPDGLLVLHHCDNPPCVNPAHLYLGTHSQNLRDSHSRNRRSGLPGEDNPAACLTWAEVERIRERLAAGSHGIKAQLGREFGVSRSTISRIASGARWRQS